MEYQYISNYFAFLQNIFTTIFNLKRAHRNRLLSLMLPYHDFVSLFLHQQVARWRCRISRILMMLASVAATAIAKPYVSLLGLAATILVTYHQPEEASS